MSRTVAQLLSQSRSILQDQRQPYRYGDSDLLVALNEALGEARRIRPDLFVGRLRAGTPVMSVPADQLPIDDMFFSALVNYTVGRAELRDDTFTTDNRAVTLITMFKNALVGAE